MCNGCDCGRGRDFEAIDIVREDGESKCDALRGENGKLRGDAVRFRKALAGIIGSDDNEQLDGMMRVTNLEYLNGVLSTSEFEVMVVGIKAVMETAGEYDEV